MTVGIDVLLLFESFKVHILKIIPCGWSFSRELWIVTIDLIENNAYIENNDTTIWKYVKFMIYE